MAQKNGLITEGHSSPRDSIWVRQLRAENSQAWHPSFAYLWQIIVVLSSSSCERLAQIGVLTCRPHSGARWKGRKAPMLFEMWYLDYRLHPKPGGQPPFVWGVEKGKISLPKLCLLMLGHLYRQKKLKTLDQEPSKGSSGQMCIQVWGDVAIGGPYENINLGQTMGTHIISSIISTYGARDVEIYMGQAFQGPMAMICCTFLLFSKPILFINHECQKNPKTGPELQDALCKRKEPDHRILMHTTKEARLH